MASRLSGPFLFVLSVAALPLQAAAQSQPPLPPLAWQCTQEHDVQFHVLCVPYLPPATARPSDWPLAAASRFDPPPLNVAADMRPVAQRGDSEVFSAEAWRVPLHAAPSDPSRVTALLESVLCGHRTDCSVRYGTSAQQSARR